MHISDRCPIYHRRSGYIKSVRRQYQCTCPTHPASWYNARRRPKRGLVRCRGVSWVYCVGRDGGSLVEREGWRGRYADGEGGMWMIDRMYRAGTFRSLCYEGRGFGCDTALGASWCAAQYLDSVHPVDFARSAFLGLSLGEDSYILHQPVL